MRWWIEHALVLFAVVLGQFFAHWGLRWVHSLWPILPPKSLWLVAAGSALGVVAAFAILGLMVAMIALAGRFGLIDLDQYNKDSPGMH